MSTRNKGDAFYITGLWITEGATIYGVSPNGPGMLPGTLDVGSYSILPAALRGGDLDRSHFTDEHNDT